MSFVLIFFYAATSYLGRLKSTEMSMTNNKNLAELLG